MDSQDAKKGESPPYRVDDDGLAALGELVNHGAKQEQVNEAPDIKGLWMVSSRNT